MFGLGYLNHRADALGNTPVIDGDGEDWELSDALFLGSDSPAETVFRYAYDSEFLYVLADVCSTEPELPRLNLIFHNPAGKKLSKGNTVSVEVGPEGLLSSNKYGFPGSETPEVVCRRGRTSDGRKGYVAEIGIPLALVGNVSELCFYASATTSAVDIFTGTNISKPQTWQRVRLK